MTHPGHTTKPCAILQLSRILMAGTLTCIVTSALAVPAFAPPVPSPFGLTFSTYYANPMFVDIEGDGDLDIYLGTYENQIFLCRNTGNSTNPAFSAPVFDTFGLNITNQPRPAFADLDGDGDVDCVLGASDGSVTRLRNTSSSSLPAFISQQVLIASNVNYPMTQPALGDLDGDGDFDLLVGSVSGYFKALLNTGNSTNPAFGSPIVHPFGLAPIYAVFSDPTLTDIDGDGDLDMFTGMYGGNLLFFQNTGSWRAPAFAAGVFDPFGIQISSDHTWTPAVGDLDGDGDPDLLCGHSVGGVEFFRNTAPGTTVTFQLVGPTTTQNDTLRFNLQFSHPVAASLTPSDFALTGSLAAGATLTLGLPLADPQHSVFVTPANPNANGTLGIQITGKVNGPAAAYVPVPTSSSQFTITHYPAGDVDKNGTFNLADVALLEDANLGLVTLP